jgi:hypothetical protein
MLNAPGVLLSYVIPLHGAQAAKQCMNDDLDFALCCYFQHRRLPFHRIRDFRLPTQLDLQRMYNRNGGLIVDLVDKFPESLGVCTARDNKVFWDGFFYGSVVVSISCLAFINLANIGIVRKK